MRRSTLDQCLNLSSCEIFCQPCKFIKFDARVKQLIIPQVFGMNLDDLLSPLSVRQIDLDVDLKSSWPQNGLIKQILSIGHPNDYDVIQSLDTIDVSQKLVYHLIAYLSTHAAMHASGFADGVDLVKNDYVERALVAELLLVGSGLEKQLSDVLLGFADEFAENLRTVYDFEIFDVQGFGQLTGYQSFSCSWRAVKQNSLYVLYSESFNSRIGVSPRGKSSSKNVEKLLIQTSNAHIFNIKIGPKNIFFIRLRGANREQRPRDLLKRNLRLSQQLSQEGTLSLIVTSHDIQAFDYLQRIGDLVDLDVLGFPQVKERISFLVLQSFNDLEVLNLGFCFEAGYDLVELHFEVGQIIVNVVFIVHRLYPQFFACFGVQKSSIFSAHADSIPLEVAQEIALENFTVYAYVDCF